MWRVVAPRVPESISQEAQNALNWSYAPWTHPAPPPATSVVPVPSHNPYKRTHSETEDCDDFSEDSSKQLCPSPTEADSCQMKSRKKRRGIIEKRRRDRINTSLSELRRLVPSAYEKQGSAKLEKAEILQLTVDYLKNIHSKGTHGLYDQGKYSPEYRSIGFQECAAEVERYLVTVEGFDIQDPLRHRLMSHLHCVAAQKDIMTSKAAPSSNATTTNIWYPPANSGPTTSHNYASFPPPLLPLPGSSNILNSSSGTSMNSSLNSSNNNSSLNSSHNNSSFDSTPGSTPSSVPPTSSSATLTPLTSVSTSLEAYHYGHHQPEAGYHPGLLQGHPYSHGPGDTGAVTHAKPYRPWGAVELQSAY